MPVRRLSSSQTGSAMTPCCSILYTASAATDARIPGLTPDEAARLRDRLASRGQARLAGL